MFNAMRDDDELTGIDQDFALTAVLAHSHAQCAFHNKEQLVFNLVVMPEELALQLGQLDVGIVDFPDDLRTPPVGEKGELVREINFLQGGLLGINYQLVPVCM